MYTYQIIFVKVHWYGYNCGQKWGHKLNLTSSGEARTAGLENSETEINHIRLSEHKNS